MNEHDNKQQAVETQDTTKLTRWVVRLLYVQIFVSAMSLVSGIFEFQLLRDFNSGLYISRDQMMADAEVNDIRQGFVTTLSASVFVVAGIAILRWIYVANANSARLSAKEMQFSPAGSVGWYFVPVVNLWKPFQAMKEIWQVSAACGSDLLTKVPAYLKAWWFLWLLNGALGNVAMRLSLEPKTMDDLLFASVAGIASDVAAIPLSMVFMTVVKEITQLQGICRVSTALQSGPVENG